MERITRKMVDGSFKRLHRAMEWPEMLPYVDGKPNVGAIYLNEGYQSTFGIEQICNDGGGVHTMFPSWGSKREAAYAMSNMAMAVEEYKRNQ